MCKVWVLIFFIARFSFQSVQMNEKNCPFITLDNGSPLGSFIFFSPPFQATALKTWKSLSDCHYPIRKKIGCHVSKLSQNQLDYRGTPAKHFECWRCLGTTHLALGQWKFELALVCVILVILLFCILELVTYICNFCTEFGEEFGDLFCHAQM